MKSDVSFSKVVKEELCSNEYDSKDRLRALLSGYIRINGTLVFRNKTSLLTLKSENAKISRFIYETINQIYDAKAHLDFLKKGNSKKTVYQISIENQSDEIIEDLEISFLEGKISKNIVKNDETISGYLTGAFLACGSVNSPSTSNYHLELALNSENYARWLSKLFGKYKNSNIEPKITKRRDKYVVYFKKSDQIANFLIMIGAVVSCMDFENVRVDRDFNNSANRLQNGDLANLKKTMKAAKSQIEEIKKIDNIFGLDTLENIKERELCKLRLEYESASLQELANLLSKRLKKEVSKSNVNHMFRSIHQRYLKICNLL